MYLIVIVRGHNEHIHLSSGSSLMDVNGLGAGALEVFGGLQGSSGGLR